MSRRTVLFALALAVAAPSLAGCASMYYETMEVFGKEKRDLLRGELSGMVDDQKEAEESFATALERVKALTQFDGGELEVQYNRLKNAYDDSQSDAEQISDRIEDIEDVSAAMFAEWDSEIAQMRTPSLKNSSRRKLRETQQRYDHMITTLRAARDDMDDVLAVFNDHVLYLKHNLNAAAVGSLGEEMGDIEDDIEALKATIAKSIAEAQSFIQEMPQ